MKFETFDVYMRCRGLGWPCDCLTPIASEQLFSHTMAWTDYIKYVASLLLSTQHWRVIIKTSWLEMRIFHNVSEWSKLSTRGMLFHWAREYLSSTKQASSSSSLHWNVICSCHGMETCYSHWFEPTGVRTHDIPHARQARIHPH
jgi:hypothetical protein